MPDLQDVPAGVLVTTGGNPCRLVSRAWRLPPVALPAFGAGVAVTAAATSPTYDACLHNGALSKVSTVMRT